VVRCKPRAAESLEIIFLRVSSGLKTEKKYKQLLSSIDERRFIPVPALRSHCHVPAVNSIGFKFALDCPSICNCSSYCHAPFRRAGFHPDSWTCLRKKLSRLPGFLFIQNMRRGEQEPVFGYCGLCTNEIEFASKPFHYLQRGIDVPWNRSAVPFLSEARPQ